MSISDKFLDFFKLKAYKIYKNMSLALDCVSLFLSKIEIIKIQFKHISTKKKP